MLFFLANSIACDVYPLKEKYQIWITALSFFFNEEIFLFKCFFKSESFILELWNLHSALNISDLSSLVAIISISTSLLHQRPILVKIKGSSCVLFLPLNHSIQISSNGKEIKV